MFKEKVDIKVLFILILSIGLILSWIFRPSKRIDSHEDEIKKLNNEKKELLLKNDSLQLINVKLNAANDSIFKKIDINQIEIANKDKQIKDLKNGKGKVSDIVRKLNANDVAKSLSNYIEDKAPKGNYIY